MTRGDAKMSIASFFVAHTNEKSVKKLSHLCNKNCEIYPLKTDTKRGIFGLKTRYNRREKLTRLPCITPRFNAYTSEIGL